MSSDVGWRCVDVRVLIENIVFEYIVVVVLIWWYGEVEIYVNSFFG